MDSQSKSKKIVLFESMVLAEGLSYKEAMKAAELAQQTPVSAYLNFVLSHKAGEEEGWSLLGFHKELSKLFIEDPDSFVIKL